jgi:hypothetical protein
MTNSATGHLRQIQDWLLAILRFAVTLEEADRAAVMTVAQDMDRLGVRRARSEFSFFARTSREICELIADRASPRDISLRRHLSRIANDRLRLALEAVLEIERHPAKSAKSRNRRRDDLWRGLPVRHYTRSTA